MCSGQQTSFLRHSNIHVFCMVPSKKILVVFVNLYRISEALKIASWSQTQGAVSLQWTQIIPWKFYGFSFEMTNNFSSSNLMRLFLVSKVMIRSYLSKWIRYQLRKNHLTLYFIMLKNGQTYLKNLAVRTPQDF